jgi:PAS domain S-box-containing protein
MAILNRWSDWGAKSVMERVATTTVPQSEDSRYRLLVDALTDYAVYMLNAEGVIATWNPGAERIKGYTAAEIIGQHFSRFYTDEDQRSGAPVRALKIANSQGEYKTEGWRVRKDSTRFWAYVVIHPIRAADGTVIGYAKITRDLTEAKAAEQALRDSEQQFRLLVEGVTDYAIYRLDTQGIIASWNTGAQRIKGYLREEIIGKHFSQFYTPEDRQAGEPQRGLEAAARVGRFEKESWRVRKDGTRFLAHVVIDAIRDDEGTLLGFAKVTRDVTERMEAQRALEAAREALFHSQKIEAIGQLTGGIAHDFNNLLMATLGSLELLRKRLPDDRKTRALFENAVQAAQRGASLTRRMLAFARRQDLHPERVDVRELVHGMASLLERSLGREIAIETRFPLNLPAVVIDANQLESALLNLGLNARDAMPNGGSITIAARQHMEAGVSSNPQSGRYVCLSVTDTGEGMDEETLQRATEPFFTTKGVGKGTGLGLPMVYGLAEQSGGRLVIESRKGQGTTVEIWLPVASPAKEPHVEDSRVPTKVVATTRPLIVLAVDDDPLVLMNTAAMLEDLGHTVLEAASGKQALELLHRTEKMDLVITDQAMPQMTGTQFAEAARAERPELPIIIATGYAELPPNSDSSLPKLNKPFLQEDLANAIAGLMQGRN